MGLGSFYGILHQHHFAVRHSSTSSSRLPPKLQYTPRTTLSLNMKCPTCPKEFTNDETLYGHVAFYKVTQTSILRDQEPDPARPEPSTICASCRNA